MKTRMNSTYEMCFKANRLAIFCIIISALIVLSSCVTKQSTQPSSGHHPEAAKILVPKKEIRIKGYVLHSVKSGESLSRIAERYYGDQSKFTIIAKYNNLTDATRIYAGQEIKVPEVEGLKFLTGKENDNIFLKKESADRIEDYRKQGVRLFQENKYKEAIDEFNKALAMAHDDEELLEYIHKAHYELAVTLFNNKDYYAARDQFKASIRYRDDCMTCVEYLQKSEELYKELHYRKGMQYYEDEQLVEAIKEWEQVIDLDPDYKKAGYHIDQARGMLRKLEEIKKNQEEGE